jgi:hypothetical protein
MKPMHVDDLKLPRQRVHDHQRVAVCGRGHFAG